jgi:GrpB-like predicted nucleotidyltransferase (UPF0157 family)
MRPMASPESKAPNDIVDYDPRWPGSYKGERDRLRIATGIATLKFEHIGPTAVPGLRARPIVELLVGAPAETWAALPDLRAKLVSLGYEDLGDGGTPGQVKLRRRTLRAFDLTLVEYQGALWNEQLRQRDALRAAHAPAT